ncbi:MAG: CoA-substrate-specific enzyme activase [Deltaproteobacteria bacterium]|nr:CoA-substrate-specific enzyme activase [Deltaproteobacteria bacterium]
MFLGIDVGSISMKFVLFLEMNEAGPPREVREMFLSPDPLTLGRAGTGYLLSYDRLLGDPLRKVPERLRRWIEVLGEANLSGVSVTGKSGRQLAPLIGGEYENDFRCLVKAVTAAHPEVRTIFEMGGENAKVVRLEPAGKGAGLTIRDYDTNGDCAAGTGSFIDQQAHRMKIEVETIGDMVAQAASAARIAGRCSVFAKSDMIHAQQKGYSPEEILKGLCEAVARNFKSNINKGKDAVPAIALVGGLFANSGVVRAIRDVFGFAAADVVVPRGFAHMSAFGAAMAAAERGGDRDDRRAVAARPGGEETAEQAFPSWPPLVTDNVVFLRDRVQPPPAVVGHPELFLGIDIGSVSTNFALVDWEGNLLKEIYVRTQGRPVQVVTDGLKALWDEFGDTIAIRGVGTTGSGRELIGELVGADTVQDEITAHKTGSTFIGNRFFGVPVDTIFEIGGQDSKFIGLDNGVVTDFAMNDACAAGTGSFLEEQAERLGIQIKGEFAALALSSGAPVRMGERCTVFMEQDLNNYLNRGARKQDLVAGLAYSVVMNYLNRVVRGRRIGETIYFQGGTAYNDSVAAAFSQVLGRKIIVPPHNGVIGAIGMALLARDKVRATKEATKFRGFDLSKVDYKRREFVCKGCSNYCDMQEIRIDESRTYWGDKCSEKFRKPARTDTRPVIGDLVALRNDWFDRQVEEAPEKGPRGTVGFPRAMYFFERFPFWKAVLSRMGFGIKVSPRTDKAIAREGIERTVAEPCYPIQVAHGHVAALLDGGVDFLFLPNLINSETIHTHTESHFCPWGQTLPFVIAGVPKWEKELRQKLLSPTVRFRDGEKYMVEDLFECFGPLGVSRREIRDGIRDGFREQARLKELLHGAGKEAVERVTAAGADAIILLGRPYNLYDRDINLNIPTKLRDQYGGNVIPIDFLPIDEIDIRDVNDNMFWNYGRKIIAAAKWCRNHPKFHTIYITNFKCGPDSFVRHFITRASGSPYLTLQFDGHGNDAGYMTRCEAYLDSKGVLRPWAKQ